MSEITRADQNLARADSPEPKFIADRLSALWSATDTFGKPCDTALLQGWELVINMNQITFREYSDGIAHFINKGGAMPTPGVFKDWILDRRSSRNDEEWKAKVLEDIQREAEINVSDWEARHPESVNWTTDDYKTFINGFARKLKEGKKL